MISILVVASMLFVATGFSYSPAVAQGETPELGRDVLYVPGELIVRYDNSVKQSTAFASAMRVAQKLGGQVVQVSRNSNLLSFDENADVEALMKEIAAQPGVAKVEPNYIRWIPEENPLGKVSQPTSIRFRAADGRTRDVPVSQLKQMVSLRKVNGKTQSVPTWPAEYYDQWGWWEVGADIIWPEKTVSPSVCVIDTGVDVKHPDLIKVVSGVKVPQVIKGFDFVNDDTDPNDDNGHGTHVTGTIMAVMNNKKGFSGISNGKAVAVKVLSAQGWGTSWDISLGIIYCANRTDVKVINMSIGGGAPSTEEFAALDYAVNSRNKLVVAAAGNESTSNFSFPGAWASPFVCVDGSDTYPIDCINNTIDQGMLSVGAARTFWSGAYDDNEDGYLWVDTDGNGFEDVVDDTDPSFWDEHFYPETCAADFSNFGQWVEIVAPGEDILSSVPVSYPFHDEYYYGADGDNDGYDWFSGTSMASPHVAAGAARAWSLNSAFTNAQIEDLLLNTGDQDSMAFASDFNMNVPADGYYDDGYSGEAPYCWPDATNGLFYDTSSAVYLNVARAMNRGSLWVGTYDAVTGLPIPGTTVKAFLGTTLKDTSKTLSDWESYVPLLNLPGGSNIDVKINKAGYTANDVWVAWHTIDAGYGNWGPWTEVGVPPKNGRIHAVLNWDGYWGDLDFFAWTPSSANYVVGPWNPGSGATYLDQGDLLSEPYARWNRDGVFGDWLGLESISIRPKAGSTTVPYYNLTANDYYDFLVTDFGEGVFNEYVILRMWVNGKIIGESAGWPTCDSDGLDDIPDNADDETWWHAGYMNGSTFTATGDCGIGDTWTNDPNGAWPYRVDRTTSGIPERPGKTK
jgi:subtilisin family serine protease